MLAATAKPLLGSASVPEHAHHSGSRGTRVLADSQGGKSDCDSRRQRRNPLRRHNPNVAIQPFLLIVRTRHIVTVTSDSDGTSSAGYSEFPAYSQIYRQQWSTVSRRSEPSSRTALTGEQPDPWDLLQPQDATSRHRGAKPFRRCGLLGRISLLSPEYLLSVERRQFHASPPDH